MSGYFLDQAVSRLRNGDSDGCAALCRKALASAKEGEPEYSEALSLLGLALLPKQPAIALDHLQRAVVCDPREPQFRLNLARCWLALERPNEAEAELRKCIELSRGHPEPLILLARLLIGKGRSAEAVALLRQALAAAPAHKIGWRLLSEALFKTGDFFASDEALKRAVGDFPQNRDDALLVARLARQLQDFDRARKALDPILAKDPTDPEAVVLANRLSEWRGDDARDEALVAPALDAHPGNSKLISLKLEIGQASDCELDGFRSAAVDPSRPAASRARILYALAQHHDRLGESDLAWNSAMDANALMRIERAPACPEELRSRRSKMLHRARALSQETSVERTHSRKRLLYLCGAPRTGGSLIQSVLAAAPDVKSVGERAALLPHLLAMVDPEGQARPDPDLLNSLRAADLKGLDRLDSKAGIFIDKTPENMQVAGLISAIHPDARFLSVFRDPSETLISILIRNFPPTFDYSYDPDTICDYLLFHAEACAAWIADGLDLSVMAFPDFVADPAGQGRRLAAWAGVPWSPDYLDPSERMQPVPTFSARQVRAPIAARPMSRAQQYREHLAPFERKLEQIESLQNRLPVRRC